MRPLVALLLMVWTARAAVEGVVVNRTNGAPAAGTVVTLYELGAGGMKALKTVKSDAQGAFRFDTDVRGANLLQAIHSGVIYNQMLQPGSSTTGLQLAVYDSSPKPSQVRVSQHMVLIEPLGGVLHVNESVIYQNEGNLAYNDSENGTLRVFLPDAVQGKPRATITAPQGMPLEREVAPTRAKNVHKVDFPVKPGETRFDITYVVPMPETNIFAGKVLHDDGPVRLVAPAGVTLTGDGIKMIGQEPSTQATVYEVEGREYAVQVEGTGQLARGGANEAEGESGGGRGIQTIPARVYDQIHLILGLALAILLVGFILLFRRGSGQAPGGARR